jgi:transaldolase
MNAAERLQRTDRSLWLDNIRRGSLIRDTFEGYIREPSVTGLASNPSIFDRPSHDAGFYDEAIRSKVQPAPAGENRFFETAFEDLTTAVDLFRPIHEATNGVDGSVSLKVSPLPAGEFAKTLEAAKRLFAAMAATELQRRLLRASSGTKDRSPL